ncbi:wax ester/triacylglycerol synthase domain-containing protein [Nocardioides sp.]|uniref:wax ester/triacylglycerol synthase domain-containing protein n=1 Tax=Nocardioides sp. TaxID=35761 RepID=UPI0027345453|nr:wax ester/triacylglycerol synthase domain-containing protein [Nocardioides sp.]MDP3893085.1 wax ester/triacylglycerol synthase family O-acyltransferase [Nocardioides sp.]
MAEFMINSDAFAWQMEHDAALRSTVVSIIMLDQPPDWDVLVDRFERICREVPMFRQRVVETFPPAPPRWEHDPDFDLDYHLRRVTAPAPGTFATVLDMARRAEMAEFDRARPLWETTVVEGLTDGAAALVCKLHHSLSDGIGAIQVAMILFDLSPESPAHESRVAEPETEARGRLDRLLDPARYDVGLVGKAAHLAVRSAPVGLLRAARRPVASTRSAVGMATSVYRMVRPINHCGSPIMTKRRLIRQLGTHEVPLPALKAAGNLAGGTLNDAFMAGIAAGLRRYHRHHGVEVGDLHVTMPLSLRGDQDPVGGNRLTLMRFDLPVGIVDPAERIARIHERTAAVRAEPSLPYTQAIAGVLNLLPRWYLASVLRHVDFLASDVPGIPFPVYLGGARVTQQYPFGPTIGAGVNITLMTYVDTCAMGINVDVGAIPDFDVFHDCLVAGFDEVLALAPPQGDAPPISRGRR